ncbi:thiamine pyrophosphate-dependent enzyme [Sorangium sp. So ce1000]|uniref:thiamine pyrophosphate-dependent enzyme n=1 Tax=Sorangium sp. So ce1000 TaxID=3133325 RepID=UPI003F61AD85
MTESIDPRPTAARLLAASLATHGVDRMFSVAGESYLSLLDALHDLPDIDLVTCRHEGSAGFMAVADAKLTGRAGVFLVSRGPGATNATIAVHAANEDATPLVLLVGGVTTGETDRESFQDFDAGRLFGGMAKAVWTVLEPENLCEFLARAFSLAESGTPGPVVLILPENMLTRRTDAAPTRRAEVDVAEVGPASLAKVRQLLTAAQRPVLLVGSRLNRAGGREAIRAAAERHRLPVLTSNKNQHLYNNRDAQYAGHLHNNTQAAQRSAVDKADLVVAVGTRLDVVTTKDHTFPASPEPRQPLVHVYPDAARLGPYHRPQLGICADPVAFLQALADSPPVPPAGDRDAWIAELHGIEERKARWEPVRAPDGVVFGAVAAALDDLTHGDVTIVVDSGTFTSWIYRYVRFGRRGRLVGISSSAMGFGVPGGVAAAMRCAKAGTPVVVVVGDGGFLMNPSELITAVERHLRLVIVVANNGSYGTIRLHQEREYPGRVTGTELKNPDFARLAEAFGAAGFTATTDQEVRASLLKALSNDGPAVVDVRTSLSYITAYKTIPTDRGR